ncbi:hypothetical protein TNCV_880351 [Trichonephila clavipes]|nr:hypothetical protein TNCV_880351 [Trichonephila clavipes]
MLLSSSPIVGIVVEFIKEGNNNDECTAAVFLDIQKAFDRDQPTRVLHLVQLRCAEKSTFDDWNYINLRLALLYCDDVTSSSCTINLFDGNQQLKEARLLVSRCAQVDSLLQTT